MAASHTDSTGTAVPDHGLKDGRPLHHRGKKANDPFLTRSLTAEVGEQFRKPASGQSTDTEEHSLLTDLIVTPLNMIGFIFSLVLIDRQQRQWRLSQHNPDTTAGWSRLWLDPEPYQASPNLGQENERPASEKGSPANAYSGWYTRKKKRAIARMEISDAFEMRKRVVVALVVWSALTLWAAAYVLRSVYDWIFGT